MFCTNFQDSKTSVRIVVMIGKDVFRHNMWGQTCLLPDIWRPSIATQCSKARPCDLPHNPPIPLCLSPFFSLLSFFNRSVPDSSMNFELHMTLVETCVVAVWGLCWCNFLHLQRAPATAHVDALYARFISSKPGMQNVLKALAPTRKNQANQLGYNPATYLDITKDREWLWT